MKSNVASLMAELMALVLVVLVLGGGVVGLAQTKPATVTVQSSQSENLNQVKTGSLATQLPKPVLIELGSSEASKKVLSILASCNIDTHQIQVKTLFQLVLILQQVKTPELILVGHGTPQGIKIGSSIYSWQQLGTNLARLTTIKTIYALTCYSRRLALYVSSNQALHAYPVKIDATVAAYQLVESLTRQQIQQKGYASDLFPTLLQIQRWRASPEFIELQKRPIHPLVATLTVNGKEYPWLFGLNYAWRVYNYDWYYHPSKPASADEHFFECTEAEFQIMAAMGVHVLRWQLGNFGNDFIAINENGAYDYKPGSINRLKWVLEYLCPKYNIYLIPVLFGINFLTGNPDGEPIETYRPYFCTNNTWRQTTINYAANLALIFPAQAYPYLLAWDLWGEPWGNDLEGGKWYNTHNTPDPSDDTPKLWVEHSILRTFLTTLAQSLKSNDPDCLVTLSDVEDPLITPEPDGLPTWWNFSYVDFFSLHMYRDDGYLKSVDEYVTNYYLPENMAVLLGECGASDKDNDVMQTQAVYTFINNAYEQGYIGALPWAFHNDPFNFVIFDGPTMSAPARNSINDTYWRDRAHVFRVFEDDHWNDVNPGSASVFRTDFNESDYGYGGGDNPHVWADPGSLTHSFSSNNLIIEGEFSYVDLYVDIPTCLMSELELWVTLIYHAYNYIYTTGGYIKQEIEPDIYTQRARFASGDIWNFGDGYRGSKSFKLHPSYYDARADLSGINVHLRIELGSPSMYKYLHLYGGQVWINKEDRDDDGLSDYEEYVEGTDPDNPDTDGDDMLDGWEVQYSLNPLNATDAADDPDLDGLTNLEEYQAGTNPTVSDTDDDDM
ncbi:MAG: hypothetical protein ACFFC7_24580, partial [Candidatus Hermodarchaeota archaeon]